MKREPVPRIGVLKILSHSPGRGLPAAPFAAGFFDGTRTRLWFGRYPTVGLANHIRALKGKWIVYAHDGGKREGDFYFLMGFIEAGPIKIMNNRIVEAKIGAHEIRDSFAILPLPLADFVKNECDPKWFEGPKRRERHHAEIRGYLKAELETLYGLIARFAADFGPVLTLGTAAMKEMRSRGLGERAAPSYDERIRRPYFYGARTEAYELGVIEGDLYHYDVSSMYPWAMGRLKHPFGMNRLNSDKVYPNTFLMTVEGENYGAFAVRRDDPAGGLDWTREYGIFHVSRYEWEAAEETGAFRTDKIHETLTWDEARDFHEYVDFWYAKRRRALAGGDEIGGTIYKLLLNASAGKHGQDPANYSDHTLTRFNDAYPADGHKDWVWSWESKELGYRIWARPAAHVQLYNVATAASIHGAARARLLRGIQQAPGIVYCDTDSIISRGPAKLELRDGLGGWRLLHVAARAAIVSPKVYALWDRDGTVLHHAHAGTSYTAADILRAARGETIVKIDRRPEFRLAGGKQVFETHVLRGVKKRK